MMRVRFDFVDGPLSIPPVSSEVIGRRLARRWFDEDTPREDKGTSLHRSRPIGFDASVQHVLQIWRTGKGAARSSFVGDGLGDYGEGEPYDGIIGFGQGAALASWLAREGICDGLRFVILVGGYEIDVDGVHLDGGCSGDNEELLDGDSFAPSLPPLHPGAVAPDAPIKNTFDGCTGEWDGNNEFYEDVGVSSLHIIGQKNPLISPAESSSLACTYLSPIVHTHPGGHCLPRKSFPAVVEFLCSQNVSIQREQSPSMRREILSQRLTLADLERRASELVLESAAIDPPKALLAVIGPNKVGGWVGPRRRGFGEEGGGAPCPSEFVRKSDER
eukprot:CAMPEP_0194272742 /NCGR_PEP_ID=MMETSP0169-20130528/6218_1 /TAXON_ID=218684 /ORGANISM="Corethron pennatum, Strain L29A3" /LENGTH=330 /DNA_ID=CAMNT_0039015477 /DNA_START=166 /DNA_END=1155 /DNA_ORIENTATION=-